MLWITDKRKHVQDHVQWMLAVNCEWSKLKKVISCKVMMSFASDVCCWFSSLLSLQRAACTYTSFKDVSWAHSHLSLYLCSRLLTCSQTNITASRNVLSSHRSWCIVTPQRMCISMHQDTPHLTAMQGDPDITHNAWSYERHHHTHSDSQLMHRWCSGGWGKGKGCGRAVVRDGGGHRWATAF